LEYLKLDEDHCRVLGTYSRPGLGIERCRITGAAAVALAQVLGRNQGPTKLELCDIDNIVLANGLRGNSRLKSLRLNFSRNDEDGDGNREDLAITVALRENKGLVDLNLLHNFPMIDENWDAICDSLKTHPVTNIPAPGAASVYVNAATSAAYPVVIGRPAANLAAPATSQKRKACP
jgi:hypothetical protein